MNYALQNREIRWLGAAGLLAVAIQVVGMSGHALAQYPRPPVRDPQHIMQRRVHSWTELKQKNIVMQKRDYSCGAAALATLIKYYWGDNVTEQQFLVALDKVVTDPKEREDRVRNGLTLTDLRRVAVAEGYFATIGKLTFQELAASKSPLLVGIVVGEYDHFVVFRGVDSYYVYLADPARGNLRIPIWEFIPQWQKNAVLVVAKPDKDPPKISPLSVRVDEVSIGRLNRQTVRRDLSQPKVMPPYPFPSLP